MDACMTPESPDLVTITHSFSLSLSLSLCEQAAAAFAKIPQKRGRVREKDFEEWWDRGEYEQGEGGEEDLRGRLKVLRQQLVLNASKVQGTGTMFG